VLEEEDVALIASDARFAGLRRLELGYNEFDDHAVEIVAQSRTLSRLTDLDYSGNRTTIAALEAVAGSPLASRLTFIGLRQHDWSEAPRIGSRAADLLASFRCLQGIDLHGEQIGDEGAEILGRSSNLADLSLLQLGQNGLGLRGVTALLSSPYLTKVEDLDLSDNRPGGDWIAALASAGPRRLRKLTLEVNQLDGQAAALLADAVALEGVRELSLRGNPIGDQGAVALAGSVRLTQLHKLDLGSCEIGDEGAIALADSPTLGRLEGFGGLGLSHNRYGQKAARHLRKRFDYDPSSY
jgi:Ran GTPase-activating protein (RanGAP) involved in mRNA processing and transport